jgi:hypothetical protein
MNISVRALFLPLALLAAPVAASAQAPLVTDEALSSVPTPAPAGQFRATPATVAAPASVAGPVAEVQPVALKARNAPVPAPKAPRRGDSSNNRALMVVGAVGLVVGAVIGGDEGTIVMLGSAGVGLLGLYRFLN